MRLPQAKLQEQVLFRYHVRLYGVDGVLFHGYWTSGAVYTNELPEFP